LARYSIKDEKKVEIFDQSTYMPKIDAAVIYLKTKNLILRYLFKNKMQVYKKR